MTLNSFRTLTASILTLTALSGTAQATLFSFASDDDSTQPTFRGTAGSAGSFNIRNGRDPTSSNPVTLKFDDNNGPLPTVSLNVGFVTNVTVRWVNSVGVSTSQTHVYSALGTLTFVNAAGAPVLTGQFFTTETPAVMTVGGTMTTWGSAGGLFGSDTTYNMVGSVVWSATADLLTLATSQGINLAPYGVAVGSSTTPDDFAFTFTRLSSSGGAVPIDSTSRLPTAAWTSEGSFSGSAINGIPTPGSAGLLALAGLMAFSGRRRRAA